MHILLHNIMKKLTQISTILSKINSLNVLNLHCVRPVNRAYVTPIMKKVSN